GCGTRPSSALLSVSTARVPLRTDSGPACCGGRAARCAWGARAPARRHGVHLSSRAGLPGAVQSGRLAGPGQFATIGAGWFVPPDDSRHRDVRAVVARTQSHLRNSSGVVDAADGPARTAAILPLAISPLSNTWDHSSAGLGTYAGAGAGIAQPGLAA